MAILTACIFLKSQVYTHRASEKRKEKKIPVDSIYRSIHILYTMAKKPISKVPDAWEDDDWETQADRAAAEGTKDEPEEPAPRLTNAERRAQHAELNRKIWESA